VFARLALVDSVAGELRQTGTMVVVTTGFAFVARVAVPELVQLLIAVTTTV
jgi:hypothetical protein